MVDASGLMNGVGQGMMVVGSVMVSAGVVSEAVPGNSDVPSFLVKGPLLMVGGLATLGAGAALSLTSKIW